MICHLQYMVYMSIEAKVTIKNLPNGNISISFREISFLYLQPSWVIKNRIFFSWFYKYFVAVKWNNNIVFQMKSSILCHLIVLYTIPGLPINILHLIWIGLCFLILNSDWTTEGSHIASFIHVCFTGTDKQKLEFQFASIFLSINLNMCYGCSKEPSQWDDSFEYPQHMF